MLLNNEKYTLSDKLNQDIFENEILPDVFSKINTVKEPVAIIFGGQPGAGKSMGLAAAVSELGKKGRCVQILGDELRDFHPMYSKLLREDDKTAAFYTDKDTGKWIEKLIDYAKEKSVNVAIEGTMRDSNKVAQTMQTLRVAGYKIDCRVVAVNSRFSEQGIIQRYENQKADRGVGRMTTSEAHNAAYSAMPLTLERIEYEKLADSVTVYQRGAVVIYDNKLDEGEWLNEPLAREAVDFERNRPMTNEEKHNYIVGFENIKKLLERPERNASFQEIENINKLYEYAISSGFQNINEDINVDYMWLEKDKRFKLIVNEKPAVEVMTNDLLNVLIKNKYLSQYSKDEISSGILNPIGKGSPKNEVLNSSGQSVKEELFLDRESDMEM